MHGYYDPKSRAKEARHRVGSVVGVGLTVSGLLFRKQVVDYAVRTAGRFADNALARQVVSSTAEFGLQGAERFQSFLQRNLGGRANWTHHFEPNSYQYRNDLTSYWELTEKFPRVYREKTIADALRRPLSDAGWSPEKIAAFYKNTGLVQSLLYTRQSDMGEYYRLLDRTGGHFREVLQREADVHGTPMEDALRSAAADLNAARTHVPAQRDQSDVGNALRKRLTEQLRERLRTEAANGPGFLERISGVRTGAISDAEQTTLRDMTDGDVDINRLHSNAVNARFIGASGHEYNLSGLRSIAMSTKDLLTDRIQIPFSPFQSGLTFGQMFPFVPRLGDRPFAGIYDRGFDDKDFQVFFGHKIISFDGEDAHVSAEDYNFIKTNKSHIRHALDAESAAETGAVEGSVFAKAYRNFQSGMGVEPGTVPYWDVASAFVRKFTAGDYLPNILRSAAQGTLRTTEEAAQLTGALQQAGLRVDDQSLFDLTNEIGNKWIDLGTPAARPLMTSSEDVTALQERNRIFGLGVLRRVDPSVGRALTLIHNSGETNEFVRWGGALTELRDFYRSPSTASASPKIRKMMTDLTGMNESDRVRYLSHTASYEDSRRAQTLFGLDVGAGAQRVTNLDILRSELLKDLLHATADSDTPLEDIASRMINRGQHNAAFFSHSLLFDQNVARGDVGSINTFLQDERQGHLRAYLERESRRKFSLLHLHPKEAATRRDFGERQGVIGLRRTKRQGDGPFGIGRAWRANTGARPVTDQDATPGSLFNYFLMDRLHSGFADIGIGLGPQWRSSPLRLAAGMIGLRYAPIFLGLPEAHKALNRITRDVPFLRSLNPDTHRANLLDAYGRLTHHNNWRRRAMAILPGLDFYTDDRTRDEENLNQRTAGYTAVRKGRWWAFGSREPFFGEKVSYYAPSAARIARSDWQAAANVNRNSWQYWRHFGGALNPTNWGNGAYWWEKSQARNRPYLTSGPAFDPDHPWNAPLNATIGRIIKPRRVFHPEALPRRLGGTLEDQPGVGRPTSPFYDRPTGYSSGSLSGTGRMPRSGRARSVPHAKRVRDARSDPRLDRINLYRQLRGEKALTGSDSNTMSPEEAAYIRQLGFSSGFDKSLYHLQEIAGLYGWQAGLMAPKVGHPVGRTEIADASRGYGRERRFYDQEVGGIGGSVSDILRRFLPHRRRSIAQYDPVRNNQPTWMPGPDYLVDFQHGDPNIKIPLGEMRLPGEAYERLHPGTKARMFRVRASSIGKSQADIESYLVQKEGDGSSSTAAELGTKMHRVLQKRWRKLGILEADEVEVFDQDLNVSGHIDAILRLPTHGGNYARTIVDIKTKTAERFQAIKRSRRAEDENLDQILFYMHTTGIRRGLLTYVNREDVKDVFQLEVKWDEKRFRKAVERMEAARHAVAAMVQSGQIGRGQLYDPVTKFEILADVAPYSAEFGKLQQWYSRNGDSLTKEEQARIEAAQKRLKRIRQGFELHAYRFREGTTHSQHVRIAKFTGHDRFEDKAGQSYRIAGTSARDSESSTESTDAWWKEHTGLEVGSHVRVLLDSTEDQSDPLRTRKAAVFSGHHNVGRNLIERGALDENQEEFSPLANVTRFSRGQRNLGWLWERFAHMDSPFHTKLLPVRSGLEQYERTDVYGKKSGSWDSPVSSYITPTLVSFFNKNPLSAAAIGAFVGAMFPVHAGNRIIGAKVGAAIGATLSIAGMVMRAGGHPFIARAVRRRREIDAYYDTLTYVKYRRLAAQETNLAAQLEGVDVDDLEGNNSQNVAKEQREHIAGLRETSAALAARQENLRENITKKHHDTRGNLQRRLEIEALQEEESSVEKERKEQVTEGHYDVGTHTLQALLYRQRARATVRGALDGGSWQAALTALPKTTRESIIDVVEHGSPKEKHRLYELLPGDQKALLGYALGVDSKKIPRLESLASFFHHRPLPTDKWAGWRSDSSLDLIKARDVVRGHKNLDPIDFGIYPTTVDEAVSNSPEAAIPLPSQAAHQRDHLALQQRIHNLVTGYGLSGIRVEISEDPSTGDNHQADVQVNVQHRREHAVFQIFKRHH